MDRRQVSASVGLPVRVLYDEGSELRSVGPGVAKGASQQESEDAVSGEIETFDGAMFEIYRRAKSEAGYPATIFLRMITERGGLATAKYLINSAKPSDGYTHLYERQRLDLTVEAMVVENGRWHELFEPEEIARARKRLVNYGYRPAR